MIYLWNVETGKTEWQVLWVNKEEMITLSPAGHLLHGDRDLMKRSLWYLVEKPNGAIEILTYSEFQKRYAAAFISLYVNRGIGVAGPAIRIGCRREITTVELLSATASSEILLQDVDQTGAAEADLLVGPQRSAVGG